MLKELTKISHQDYMGKELCKGCNKAVTEKQAAILCDTCSRWIHRKCSDMPDKTYKQNMRKKSFKWSCNVCRVDETPTKEKANINVLTREEMPDTKETMNEGKVGDLKIIHMNARSILNKIEELNIICEDLQPDVLSTTETWMA